MVVRAEGGDDESTTVGTVVRADGKLTVELSTEDVRKTIQLDQISPAEYGGDSIIFITGVALGSKAEELGLVPGASCP